MTENAKHLNHNDVIDDKILIPRDGHFCKLEGPYLGSYYIVQVYTDGTVYIQQGTVTECINIRRITLYTVEQEE